MARLDKETLELRVSVVKKIGEERWLDITLEEFELLKDDANEMPTTLAERVVSECAVIMLAKCRPHRVGLRVYAKAIDEMPKRAMP